MTTASQSASLSFFTRSRPSSPSRVSISRISSSCPSIAVAASVACCSSVWRRWRSTAAAAGSSGPCSTETGMRYGSTDASARNPTPSGRCTGSPASHSARLPENRGRMEILRPKELDTHPGEEIVAWAREQLGIAGSILDNPGGGLLFATQAIGQVRSGLIERDAARWKDVIALLDRAEDAAVRREFGAARQLLDEATPK